MEQADGVSRYREPRFAADSVTADNIKVGRLATEHLVTRGHKRIAIIVGQLGLRVTRIGWKVGSEC